MGMSDDEYHALVPGTAEVTGTSVRHDAVVQDGPVGNCACSE
jgi:hypothetical protein